MMSSKIENAGKIKKEYYICTSQESQLMLNWQIICQHLLFSEGVLMSVNTRNKSAE